MAQTEYDRLFKVHDNQIDLIFLVDTSASSQSQIRVPDQNGNIKSYSRLELISDAIKKIATLHDCKVMPGTSNFGHPDQLDCPNIDYNNKVPPWGTNADGSLLSEEELENMPALSTKRFSIRIEGQHVNIGIVKISSTDDCQVISSILNYPESLDRHHLFKKIQNSIPKGDGKDYLTASKIAMYESFFGPRSSQIKKRFFIYIGDGDAEYGKEAHGLMGLTRSDRIFSYKRPLDINLRREGIISNKEPLEGLPLKMPTRYSGADKQEWYKHPVQNYSFFIGVGDPKNKGISPEARKYAFDYEKSPGNPLGFIELTDRNNPDKEFSRILGIVNMVDTLCYDNGFQNLFSVTLHNCGPHEVTLLNTIINFENDEEYLPLDNRPNPHVGSTRWRVEALKNGIPKGGDYHNVEYLSPGIGGSYGYMQFGNEDGSFLQATDEHQFVVEATPFDDPSNVIGALNLSMEMGRGGQFYNDPANRNILEDINDNHNILWHSFNTKYEVWRRGVLYNINGGWSSNWLLSKGVRNDGVAFKNMPVRVFRSQSSGLEVIDYNIGNVSEENGYMGDYSHLPVINRGQELDLFFGVRANESLSPQSGFDAVVEKIQIIVNSRDKTLNQMQAYANMHFNLSSEMPKPTKGRSTAGLEMYLPYEITEYEEPEEEEPPLELPIYGEWEISMPANYFHPSATIKLTLPKYPTENGGLDENGNQMGSTEEIMVGDAMIEHEIDTADYDIGGFCTALLQESKVNNEEGLHVADLSSASTNVVNGYTAPTASPVASTSKIYNACEFVYFVSTNELYVFSAVKLSSATQSEEPPPPYLKIGGSNISYDLTPAAASASGQSSFFPPDSTYSTFQFYFSSSTFPEDTSVSGKMNDIKSALKGSHGKFFIAQQTWADLADPTVPPSTSDPAASSQWINSNFQAVTMSKS